MNVGQAIANILKLEGVDVVVGYPVNFLYERCAEVDIRTIAVRQERTAVHMADAYSRMHSGNKIGVFICQHGPGIENAFGGIAQAYSESVPILCLPMGYNRRHMNVDKNFNASLNFKHVTKTCEPITMGSATVEIMRRAFARIRNGRPGPALVEVPMDVFSEEAGDLSDYTPSFTTRSGPDPEAVKEVAGVLAAAERPVIYAGQGIHYAEAWPELKELAELLSIPVTTSLEGKSSFPENHPLSLGSGGRALPQTVHEFLLDADVIFGVGCSFSLTAFGINFTDQGLYLKGDNPPTIIHSTMDPDDLNRGIPTQYPLVGDAKLTLQALIDELKGKVNKPAELRSKEVPPKIESIREAWLEEWKPKRTSDEIPIDPNRVLHDLLETVDLENTIITHDAGSPRDQLSPFWQSIKPLSYIGWGKTTQLGYGLGLAMGAKLAHPDKLCINVWGDAAIGFTGMDFETAVREKLPILSIQLNNFQMAMEIPVMPVSKEKYGSTDISGHYANMAKAFGGYGERVEDPAEIKNAIKRGIKATEEGTPALLEFITAQDIKFSLFK